MGPLLWFLVLLAALAALVKAADEFTAAAEKIGFHFGVPQLIVGVTIVSIGTSLPELASSVVAALAGASEVVIGNAVGSNIANILLILGLGAVTMRAVRIRSRTLYIDQPVLIAATLFLTLFLLDLSINWFEALLLVGGFALYLFWLVATLDTRTKHHQRYNAPRLVVILLLSGLVIYGSSVFVVRSVIEIAESTGFSQGALAATIVAVGTSVPELAVTIVGGLRKRSDIVFGNIIGSCIFNILGVIGVASLLGPVVITPRLMLVSIPTLIITTLLLYYHSRDGWVTRSEGFMLITLYALFLVLLFI